MPPLRLRNRNIFDPHHVYVWGCYSYECVPPEGIVPEPSPTEIERDRERERERESESERERETERERVRVRERERERWSYLCTYIALYIISVIMFLQL